MGLSLIEQMMVVLATHDRLEFLKFRQRIVAVYGQEYFTNILLRAQRLLKED